MQPLHDTLIMAPFNITFFILTALFFGLLIAVSIWIKDKSDRLKRNVISVAAIITFIGFFVYKYQLSIDVEYNEIMAFNGGFNWWAELPLQFCNINMILIPLSLKTNYRPLMSFCFFAAPLAAFMAIIVPAVGFYGYSIMLPRMLGYYLTHYAIVIEGIAIAAFGLYKPKFRDIPKTLIMPMVLGTIIFIVNVIFRTTGLCTTANYFFTMDTEQNPLLEIFYSWIPVPLVYLLPSIVILAVYMSIITIGFRLFSKEKEQTSESMA